MVVLSMKSMLLICFCFFVVGCEQRRPAEIREFPQGFHGWAIVVWDVPSYPELPNDNGKIVERFPADGVIITSSKQNFGWAHDEEYFIDLDGQRLARHPYIALQSNGRRQGTKDCKMYYSQLFVGTDAEAQSAGGGPVYNDALFSRICPDNTGH